MFWFFRQAAIFAAGKNVQVLRSANAGRFFMVFLSLVSRS